MPALILLADVVEALEFANDESDHYLDPESGEILMITNEEIGIVEEKSEEDWAKYPKWQQEKLPQVRDFLRNPAVLRLPDKFDIHEWEIMRRFAEEQESSQTRQELLSAVHHSGAFRRFKSTVHALGIEQSWYKFRQKALEEIAREWLEENKLPYK
jgi:Uncharacterised protein family (UPF0158)